MSTQLTSASPKCPTKFAALLHQIPAGRRGAILQAVVSFLPCPTIEASFAVGELRAAFADDWEACFNAAVPVQELRSVFEPPVPIRTALQLSKFSLCRECDEIQHALGALFPFLQDVIRERQPH